jgi:uncharacterized protein
LTAATPLRGTLEPLPVRLPPGTDLKGGLDALVRAHALTAAFVVAGMGSLCSAALRLAGAAKTSVIEGDLELLSLSGTLSPNGSHLHASIADAAGTVLGGHVVSGCIVRTTAEVLIASLPDHAFERVTDPATGFRELRIKRTSR